MTDEYKKKFQPYTFSPELEKIMKKYLAHNFITNSYGEVFKENWKIKDKIPPTPPEKPVQKQTPKSREESLRSLDAVFLDDELKDEIVTRTAIPDLLEGNEPAYTGVILYGPPGTGKTVLLRAIGDVYQTTGAYAKDISVSSLNSMWVNQFARNLEEQIQIALQEAKRRGKPSFLYFDEGSILAQNASEGAASSSKHYQEAIDVLKRYVGNERNLVIAISTNLLSESFEDALTREGRLTTFFIGYPGTEQRKRMWQYFADKYHVLGLTDEQASALAEATPAEQGAFIEEFARNYRRMRQKALLKDRGYKTLVDALKHNVNIRDRDVTASITYDTLLTELDATLKAKEKRTKEEQKNGHKPIGFGE